MLPNQTVFVVVAAHNRRPLTTRFVQHLLSQTYNRFELILVDDGSSDGTVEAVLTLLPEAIIIRGKGDWWWGGSLHQAYVWIRENRSGEDGVVLLINDDTDLPPTFLTEALLVLAEKNNHVLLAQARDADGTVLEQGFKVNFPLVRFRNVQPNERPDCATTRGLFLRMADFLALGGFHPTLLPHYASDIEYTLRIPRRGLNITVDPRVWLTMQPQHTGTHLLKAKGVMAYFRRLFSKKASHNPVYMSSLILLAWPWWAMLPALIKVWLLPIVEFWGLRRNASATAPQGPSPSPLPKVGAAPGLDQSGGHSFAPKGEGQA